MFNLINNKYNSKVQNLKQRIDDKNVNTNPHLMKILVKHDPSFLSKARKEAITKELVELAINNNVDSATILKFVYNNSENKIFCDKNLVNELCKISGKVLNYIPGEGLTFEAYKTAISHKDLFYIYSSQRSHTFSNVNIEEIEKFIEYDGNLMSMFDVNLITPSLIELALNNNNKPFYINKLPTAFFKSKKFISDLCQINGKYLTKIKNYVIDIDILRIAMNHPDEEKRITIEDLEKYFLNNLFFPYYDILDLCHKDKRWYEFVDKYEMDKETLIKELINGNIKLDSKLIAKYKNDNEILDNFIKVIEKENYSISELVEILKIPEANLKFVNSNFFQYVSKKICSELNIDFEWFKYNINRNINYNSDILENIEYRIFDERFNDLFKGFRAHRLGDIMVYSDIQSKIISIGYSDSDNTPSNEEFSKKRVKLLARMTDAIIVTQDGVDMNEWIPDFNELLEKILTKKSDLKNFIDNVDEMSDTSIKNLANYLLDHHGFVIKTIDDLENYEQIRKMWINNTIESSYDLEDEIKAVALEKVFGIGLELALLLNSSYSTAVLENPKEFPKDLVDTFETIKLILSSNDIKKLKSSLLSIDINCESKENMFIHVKNYIKRKIMESYNQKVFKPEDNEIVENLYGTNFYLAASQSGDKEFGMIISVLGAFNSFFNTDPNIDNFNYKEKWNYPNVHNHGICCSYIGNSFLGTVDINNIILGFTNFEEGELLLSGPQDIYSNNESFDIIGDEDSKSNWLFPDMQLDFTREEYNEIVLERKKGNKKRQPSYIVFICDDFSKTKEEYLEKFDSNNNVKNKDFIIDDELSLLRLSVKAAKEFNLPIVVIEKEKIYKQQVQKNIDKLNSFLEDNDLNHDKIKSYYHDIITTFETCHFGFNKIKFQDSYFSSQQANVILKKVEKKITNTISENPNLALIMIEELEKVENQEELKSTINKKVFDYSNIINFCSSSREKIENLISKNNIGESKQKEKKLSGR